MSHVQDPALDTILKVSCSAINSCCSSSIQNPPSKVCSKASPGPFCLTDSFTEAAKRSETMQTDERVEEETVPNYDSSRYYPVQIRDIFQDRYEVLGKLGYGATSTTWFCRDQ